MTALQMLQCRLVGAWYILSDGGSSSLAYLLDSELCLWTVARGKMELEAWMAVDGMVTTGWQWFSSPSVDTDEDWKLVISRAASAMLLSQRQLFPTAVSSPAMAQVQDKKITSLHHPVIQRTIPEICRVSVKRRARALRLISLAGSRSGLVGLLTVTHPLPSDTPGGRVGLCRGQRPPFRGRCAGLG